MLPGLQVEPFMCFRKKSCSRKQAKGDWYQWTGNCMLLRTTATIFCLPASEENSIFQLRSFPHLVPPVMFGSVSRETLVYDLGLRSALTTHRLRSPPFSLAQPQLTAALYVSLLSYVKGAFMCLTTRLCEGIFQKNAFGILILLFGVVFNLAAVLWKHFKLSGYLTFWFWSRLWSHFKALWSVQTVKTSKGSLIMSSG